MERVDEPGPLPEDMRPPPARPRGRASSLFWGCFLGTIVAWFVICGISGLGVKAFINFGVASDVAEYIDLVLVMEIDEEKKADLVSRLEQIRSDARQGDHVGLFLWLDHDEAIRDLLQDGLTDTEIPRLESELRGLERR